MSTTEAGVGGSGLGVGRPTKRRPGPSVGGLEVADPRPALDRIVETYEHKVGPRNGAQVVARAWVDQEFRQRLLADGSSAMSSTLAASFMPV